MQQQDINRTKALLQDPRLGSARRPERQSNHDGGHNTGVCDFDNTTNSMGNLEKAMKNSPDTGVQSTFGLRPTESGPSRPYTHSMGYSPRGVHTGYRDAWMGKSTRSPGIQYHYPPSGVYSPDYEIHSSKAYMDCDQGGYPYYMSGGVPYHRRSLSAHPRTESRFAMEMMSIPNRMAKVEGEPGKSPKMGSGQGSKFQSGSTASWYERSAASFEKSKEIFEFISKRCESQECSHSDQERLVHITKERTVRQLDFNAASQALKAVKVMEKRWSTEPHGDGFRTAAKDIRGLIENNSIDATRLMYPISDVYVDPQEAEIIATESEAVEKRAVYMKLYAETTAQTYGIPLYTSSDNFLEYAEQAYLPSDADMACPGTAALDDPGKQHTLPFNVNKADQFRAVAPQTSLALFVNNPPIGAEQAPMEGQRNGGSAGANMPKVSQLHNILIKDGVHINSQGTFDRKSNTWNPNHDSFSPNYDSYAIGQLPWTVNDDMIPTGANDILEELSSGGMHRAPATIAAEACSSKEESKSAGLEKTVGCKSGQVTPTVDAPLCFCGLSCQKKQANGITFWGCKTSTCQAEMPIIDDGFKQADTSHHVEKSKSGRKLKPSKKFSENLSSQTEKCSDLYRNRHSDKSPRITSQLQKRSSSLPSKNPMSLESSGLKDSGTIVKLDSNKCRKSSLCDRINGHSGKCSKKKNSSNSSADRQDKKLINALKASPKESDQFCSPDKSGFHPEDELIFTNGVGMGTNVHPSSESKDLQKEVNKASTESTKVGKGSHGASDACKQAEAKSGNQEISSIAMLSSKDESKVRKREAAASAKLLDIAELVREELSKIPEELRCTKKSTCLNVNGHVGRCRERPRAAGNIKIKKSTPEKGMPNKKQKTSLGVAETTGDAEAAKNVETGSTIMSTSTDGPAKGSAKIVDRPSGENKEADDAGKQAHSDKVEPTLSADVPVQDPATCKTLSNAMLSTSKEYVDGLHLLKYEFEKLSSEHIRKFYGCSQVFPVEEWIKQKGEYLTQCSIIKQSPSLHSSFLFNSRKSRLAANGCQSITVGDLQNYVLKREKSLYELGKSDIHGFGLFASSALKAETPVTELLGEYIPHTEALEREKVYTESNIVLNDIIGKSRGNIEHPRHMIFRIDQKWDLDATKAGSCARFANHSCSPNCEIHPRTDPAGAVHLVLQTLRDIQEGEELTFNYQDLDALHGFACSCKSPCCKSGKS